MMIRFIKNIYRYVKNVVKYTPTLWADRDWDYYHLLNLIKVKIGFMEKEMLGSHILDAEKFAKRMRVCVILLDRLCKDRYLTNALKDYHRKYGDRWMGGVWKDDEIQIQSQDKEFLFYNPIQSEKEKRDFRKACLHSDYMETQDLFYLFIHMRKYIRGWWT